MANSVGSYYTIYVLGDFNIYGLFSMAGMIPMIVGLFLTPVFVKKYGMFKTNVVSLIIAVVVGIPYIIVGMQKMVYIMLILLAVRGVFASPIVGTKIGSGIGTALAGFLLSLAHYDGTAMVQAESTNLMITVMYVVLPVVALLIELLFVCGMNVENENRMLAQKESE